MLVHEVSLSHRRWWWSVAGALALASVVGAAILLMPEPCDCSQVPAPVVAPAPAPAPPSPPPAPSPPEPQPPSTRTLDEPITLVAAASDAPVIAMASEQHVWISRDDGKTFTRALDSGGKIKSLFVESDGRVYVLRSDWGIHGPIDELGIADPDGRERWREPPRGSLLLDARGGWIVGAANVGGMVVGWDAGNKWDRIPATLGSYPWRMTMGRDRVSYYFATNNEGTERSMDLLVANERDRARRIWSLPSADGVGMLDSIVPCAAFGGDTLYLVVRGRKPGSGRLVAVGPDGRPREHALVGQLLDDHALTCDIAGNDRATFLTLHTSRTLHRVIRIDTGEPRDVTEHSAGFDRIAVDAHGNLLYLAHGCVMRLSQAARQTQLACGPEPR